jgi:hypothetical protein
MASIEIIVRDEQGNIISCVKPYTLELGQQSLDEIEGAVEGWRRRALPEIEAKLLTRAQGALTQRYKKGD